MKKFKSRHNPKGYIRSGGNIDKHPDKPFMRNEFDDLMRSASGQKPKNMSYGLYKSLNKRYR